MSTHVAQAEIPCTSVLSVVTQVSLVLSLSAFFFHPSFLHTCSAFTYAKKKDGSDHGQAEKEENVLEKVKMGGI
jgi:hypothetical protein